jgi:hypothetical protein
LGLAAAIAQARNLGAELGQFRSAPTQGVILVAQCRQLRGGFIPFLGGLAQLLF